MKELVLECKEKNDFIVKFIPNFFLKLIKQRIESQKNLYIFKYIKDNYNISINDLFNALTVNCLRITKLGNNVILSLNKNIYISDSIKLETIVNLIDYGNINVKGINLFNDSLLFVKNNLFEIYTIYHLKGGKI